MSKIRAIAFDFMGVLGTENDYELDEIDSVLERKFGQINDDLQFIEWAKLETGLEEEEIRKRIDSIPEKIYVLRDPKVFDLLKSYRLALATNHISSLEKWVKKSGLENKFELIVNSASAGASKPSEKFYKILLEKLKLEPREILFIDDREENIEGAEKLGIKTMLYKSKYGNLSDCVLFKIKELESK